MTDVVPGYLRRRLRNYQAKLGLSDRQVINLLIGYIEAIDRGDQPLPHEDNVYSVVQYFKEHCDAR